MDIVVARGPLAATARLLADLARLVAEARRDPALLARPVLVVVPSAALRERLAVAVARQLGPAVLGVAVLTLRALARDVLARAGRPAPADGEAFLAVWARRAVTAEPALRDALGHLDDGHALVAATLHDLLDAGLTPDHVAPLLARLAGAPPGPERERAEAIVRTAGAVAAHLRSAGAGLRGHLLAAAADVLDGDDPATLPARAVFVHGFADATGLVATLLRALVRRPDVRLYVDEPPDPARRDAPDRGAAFVRAFVARLGARDEVPARTSNAFELESSTVHVDAFDASGADAECREVAWRIRALLDAGARPESIAVVARRLDDAAVSLRRHLGALGVPFSGGAAPAALHPTHHRARAVLELLRRGEAATVDRWLDARPGPRTHDHRLALRALGAARLADVVRLDLAARLGPHGACVLPVRAGVDVDDTVEGRTNGAAPLRRRRRTLPADTLRDLVAAAGSLLAHLSAWPRAAPPSAHVAHLRALLADHLGLARAATPGAAARLHAAPPHDDEAWHGTLDRLAALPDSLDNLNFSEFAVIVENMIRALGEEHLGGAGAGVAVLDVTAARGLVFEHLFLVGLNRGAFPRSIGEDVLLADDVRAHLAAVLPDLPLKTASRDEERYLFAQLLSAAARLTVSWQRTDEDGRERAPSAFVSRLRAAGLDAPHVPRRDEEVLSPPHAGGPARPRPIRAALRQAALTGGRDAFAALLPLALEDGWIDRPGAPPAAVLAAARRRVLDEIAPDLATHEGRAVRRAPGPYLGFVGRGPRPAEVFVTALEAVARCPWRAFLDRLLGLQAAPDPLCELPDLSPLVLGSAVHVALERLVGDVVGRPGEDLTSVLRAGAVLVPRPDPDTVRAVVAEVARDEARAAGLHLPGLVRTLATRAERLVARAFELEPEGPLHVAGVEVHGRAVVGGREVRFKADRVDLHGDVAVLVDYKTGRAITDAVARDVRLGMRLQAAVYAAATGGRGRYDYLKTQGDEARRTVAIEAEDAVVREDLPRVVARLFEAWDAGVFPPRVEDPREEEPPTCGSCDFAAACVRHDSGQRRRLRLVAGDARDVIGAGRRQAPELDYLARLWYMDNQEIMERSR